MGATVVGQRTDGCIGCDTHRAGEFWVRSCARCQSPVWVSRIGIRMVVELGSLVVCTECSDKPDGIVLVRESEFERAIEEAKRHRDARRRVLEAN